jgi:Holliday junction resolvase RusA-like endonuclease
MTARTVRLDLDLPPSVNSAFANVPGKGRVRTTVYRQWQKGALAEIQVQVRGVTFRGAFRLAVLASDQGLSRDRDADNLAKAVSDILVRAAIVADDNHQHMRAIDLEWRSTLPAGRCVVEVREISPTPLPKPTKAPRPKDAGCNTCSIAKAAVPASIMTALRRRGINIAPGRIRIQ